MSPSQQSREQSDVPAKSHRYNSLFGSHERLAEQFLISKEPANGYDNLTVIHLSWYGPQAVLLTGSLSHGLDPELPGKFEHSWHTRAKASGRERYRI